MSDIKAIRREILKNLVPKYAKEMNACKTLTDAQFFTSNLFQSLGKVTGLKDRAWDECVSLMSKNIGNRFVNVFREFQTLRTVTQDEIQLMKEYKKNPDALKLTVSLHKLANQQ